MYQHRNWQGALLDYPVSKVVCVGSNYANHIKEMGSATPEEPVLFIKPETALCDIRQPLAIPADMGAVHHEVELAVLIGATLRQATEDHVRKAIAGYGVALDLTLRDIQGKMKKAGQPWEKAKGFDNACPISGFIPVAAFCGDPQNTVIGLNVNGEVRPARVDRGYDSSYCAPYRLYEPLFYAQSRGRGANRHAGRRGAIIKRR